MPLSSDPRFTGTRFGNALHAVLEKAHFADWLHWRPGQAAPDAQGELIRSALRGEGYLDTDIGDGAVFLTELTGHTLTTPMPEGGPLASLAADDHRAEIEFHFAMQRTRVSDLLHLLHQYGVATERDEFAGRSHLEGLMTGKIDLTYTRDGRWYVLDYKTNRLQDYSAASLASTMRSSQYDLQALIYTLALHRWLRFRLGDGYDYVRDFGGIRYLFCRGLGTAGEGIFADRYAPELVHALDDLLSAHKDRVA